MLQDLGKHKCGLRVSVKKRVEGRGGEDRIKSTIQDRAEVEGKPDRVAGRRQQAGRRGPDGKGRRRWSPQHQAAALWRLSHSYFGGVNFLPIWGNLAGVLTSLGCLRLQQPVTAE